MVKEMLLKATSAELLKNDCRYILQACSNKEFVELLNGYMEIKINVNSNEIEYKYNLVPLIAYNLAANSTIQEEIDGLYEKHEQCATIRKRARSMNTWMTKMVPVQHLDRYFKVLCLLELLGKKELSACKCLDIHGTMKTTGFPMVGLYRSCEFDPMNEEQYEELVKEVLRLVKKANKKLYRTYKNEKEIKAPKFLCDVYSQEKVLIKTTSQLAVLMLFSFLDDEIDIHVSDPESIPVSLNYILQDFAECYSVNRKEDLPAPSAEQKRLISEVASGNFRCAYSQVYAEKKQHFAKFAKSDGVDAGKYYENALVAYRSMYPDTDFNEEDINNFLIGAVYIQILLDHLSESQSSYEETLLNAEEAKEKVRKAEKNLMLLRNKEMELNKKFQYLEKEREEMLSTIQDQEKQIESLQNKLQAAMAKKDGLQQRLSEQMENPKKEDSVPTTDEVKDTDIEHLKEMKACFIGGHPNFTKKVKQKFPEWRFIEEKQGNFPKNMLENCEVIFQAENHCNHALSERLNDAIGKEMPCIFIGNITNLTLCIQKMVTECKKRKLL